MRRPSWAGCEGSPNRLPGVVHVVGQACGNAPAGNDRSRIGRLAADPRPPRGEVAVDDVGVEGDDSVDTRSAHNLGRWCGGLDGQHGWPDGDRHRGPPEQEKTYCASPKDRHFTHLPSVCRRRMCSAYTCDQAHQAGRPTAQAIRLRLSCGAWLRIGLYPTFTQSGVVSGCSGYEYGGIEYGGLPIFRDCSGATTDFVLR